MKNTGEREVYVTLWDASHNVCFLQLDINSRIRKIDIYVEIMNLEI